MPMNVGMLASHMGIQTETLVSFLQEQETTLGTAGDSRSVTKLGADFDIHPGVDSALVARIADRFEAPYQRFSKENPAWAQSAFKASSSDVGVRLQSNSTRATPKPSQAPSLPKDIATHTSLLSTAPPLSQVRGGHLKTSEMVTELGRLHTAIENQYNTASKDKDSLYRDLGRAITTLVTNKAQTSTARSFLCIPIKAKKSATEVLTKFKAGIDGSDMNYKFKLKAKSVVDKLQAEVNLGHAMQGNATFNHFDHSQGWRLFIDGNRQTDPRVDTEHEGALGFDGREMGYMAGMMNGFTSMLQSVDAPLTPQMVIDLHDTCVDNVISDGLGSVFGSPMEQDLRPNQRTNGFDIEIGTPRANGSAAGLKELRDTLTARGNTALFSIQPKGQSGEIELKTKPTTQAALRQEMGQIIGAYHHTLARLGPHPTANQTIGAIARCVQDLEQLHAFTDGNARTNVMLVMNKLLIQNDLAPAIIDNPNKFDAFSNAELVEVIKEGQVTFAGY